MADVTINYEGNAIATMSASGTKTLLTEGKYCTDDIEVVYVSPGGGGGSMLSGSFTPASNLGTVTIAALAGTTLTHFFCYAEGGVDNSLIGDNTRSVGAGFIDFTSSIESFFDIASNGAGTSMTAVGRGAQAGSSLFQLNRATGELSTNPTTANSGYFKGGLTYYWMAW